MSTTINNGDTFGSIRDKLNASFIAIDQKIYTGKEDSITSIMIKDANVTTNKIQDSAITIDKLADGAVELTKITNLTTMTLIGNVAGIPAVPTEVVLSNDPSLGGNSGIVVPTEQAVRAYVDSAAVAPWTHATSGTDTNALLADNGYQILPSGLIMQWGRAANAVEGGQSTSVVTFLNGGFPSMCLNMQVSMFNPTGDVSTGATDGIPQVVSYSKTSATVLYQGPSSGLSSTLYIQWFAIGY